MVLDIPYLAEMLTKVQSEERILRGDERKVCPPNGSNVALFYSEHILTSSVIYY